MQTLWLRGRGDAAAVTARGVFETLRWHDGPPPAWLHHQERWQRGIAALGLADLPLAALMQDAQTVLFPDALWRVRLTAYPDGAVELAWRPLTDDERAPLPRSLQVVGQVAEQLPRFRDCKTTDLQGTQVWRARAQALGADDALLRGPDGQWAEATTANVLCGLADGRSVSPWRQSAALPGTTLAWLAERLPIAFERLDDAVLPQVQWAILTNAIHLLRVVSVIDGRALSPPPPEILALRDALALPAMLTG